MIERLLENWLDSVGERSYQACFVQMLAAQDYCVLHSTRHCALEFGKDVLAIAPDGIPCAFQLKGHPGGRLGLSEFRSDLQQQLIQLMSQPIVFPGRPSGKAHRSFLVSNGYFEEEVHRAIDDLNRGPYLSSLTLIGRGQLLDWARKLGSSLWPSEISNIRKLIEIFLYDGRDQLPTGHLSSMLEEILALRVSDVPLKEAEIERAIPSAALLTGVATHNFAKEENHFAVASAWCIFFVSAIASLQRSNIKPKSKSKQSLLVAEETIKDALVALWNEMQAKGDLTEGNALAEPEVYRWRYTLLCGLLSTLWFFPENSSEDAERRETIGHWLNRRHGYLYLWGEAAIPCFLAIQIFRRAIDKTKRADLELVNLFQAVLESNQSGSTKALPDPYYHFEDVGRVIYGLKATEKSSALKEETFAGSSYFAELLLQLMAKYGLKEHCKKNWPYFNRLFHKHFVPEQSWHYGLLKCTEGFEEARQYPPEYTWKELCENANETTCAYLPQGLATKPYLLLLWLIIAPHRLTADVGRVLDEKLRGQY